jgi:hypothetical protein
VENERLKQLVVCILHHSMLSEMATSFGAAPALGHRFPAQRVQGWRILVGIQMENDFEKHGRSEHPGVHVEHLFELVGERLWCQPGGGSKGLSRLGIGWIEVEPVDEVYDLLASSGE